MDHSRSTLGRIEKLDRTGRTVRSAIGLRRDGRGQLHVGEGARCDAVVAAMMLGRDGRGQEPFVLPVAKVETTAMKLGRDG